MSNFNSQDPSMVFSIPKNIRSSVDSDLIYKVTIVVRRNDNIDNIQDYIQKQDAEQAVWGAAAETVLLWTKVADAIFSGDLTDLNKFERKYIAGEHFPYREGASNVTVFGTVFDSVGKSGSLTLTEYSGINAINYVLYGMWLYEQVCQFGDGTDLNVWNSEPFRNTSHIGINKEKGVKKNAADNKVASPPKVIKHMEEIENLQHGEIFTMHISKLEKDKLGDEDIYRAYGWINGEPAYKKSVYFYNNKDSQGIIGQMNDLGLVLKGNMVIDLSKQDFWITCQALKSKNNKYWFKPIALTDNKKS